MLDLVAVKNPRGPIEGVEGAYVRALRYDLDLSLMEMGNRLGKEKATIQRWEKTAVDDITWLGMLVRLGKPTDYLPSVDSVDRARDELAKLKKVPRATKRT